MRNLVLMFICIVMATAWGCKPKAESVSVLSAPVLSASKTNLVLKQDSANKKAVTFSWTEAKISGSSQKVSYFFEWDYKGNNFSRPNTQNLGGETLYRTFTVGQLDTLLSVLPYYSPTDVETRIVCATSDGAVNPFFSNVITLTVSTYPTRKPLPFSALWLVGDAGGSGWSLANAMPLTQSLSDPYVFTWSGQMGAGEFKIATSKTNVNAPYYQPLTNHPDISVTSMQLKTDSLDYRWLIPSSGNYTLSLNLLNNSITIKQNDISVSPYNSLWLVGDATPTGWNFSSPTPLVQNATDPFVFSWTGTLSAGEFKILTALNDFHAPCYRPLTNHPPITETGIQLYKDSIDEKWQIITPGVYSITLNLRAKTINIVPSTLPTPPYSTLWLVGDATSAGWNINSPLPMLQSSTDAWIFTWQGILKPANNQPTEFKIATVKGDWNAKFYRPQTNHPVITSRAAMLNAGMPDNKWQITDSATYSVTVNTRDTTVIIVKQ